MTLTSGKGPLSASRAGWFTAPIPDGVAYVEPFQRRVRGVRGEKTVVDSERVLLIHRAGGAPVWAFPVEDVDGVESSASSEVPDYVEVPWRAVDAWYQEEDEIKLHAPNPYHRVEYLRSKRHLRVTIADEVFVDTTDTLAVYETALDPKLYVSRDAVRMDLLVPSATRTHCPYKGDATYFSARVGDTEVADVAWSYEDPIPEAEAIRGLVSFEVRRADVTTDIPPPATL